MSSPRNSLWFKIVFVLVIVAMAAAVGVLEYRKNTITARTERYTRQLEKLKALDEQYQEPKERLIEAIAAAKTEDERRRYEEEFMKLARSYFSEQAAILSGKR